jgi:tetratricopeptide (TPR) repeat protein
MPWSECISVHQGHWDLRAWASRPAPEAVLARFGEDQEAFDIRLLEDLLVGMGENTEILAQLGLLYTRAGRHRDALAIDRRLVALRPRDATAFYNLACSHALLKQLTRAFAALKKAVELGYRDFEHMQLDTDLDNLHKDPRWHDLLSGASR